MNYIWSLQNQRYLNPKLAELKQPWKESKSKLRNKKTPKNHQQNSAEIITKKLKHRDRVKIYQVK